MESKSIYKYARVTPRKARRVVDLIRGKGAGEAMIALRFMPYRAARLVEKVLRSAMANAEDRFEQADAEKMKVSKVFVDCGPSFKRVMPRAQGRANIIKKRTSHITVYLTGEEK